MTKTIDLNTIRVLHLPTGEPVYVRHFRRKNLYAGTRWAPLWAVWPCDLDGEPLKGFLVDITEDKPTRRWLLNSTGELSGDELELWDEYCDILLGEGSQAVEDIIDLIDISDFNDWMQEDEQYDDWDDDWDDDWGDGWEGSISFGPGFAENLADNLSSANNTFDLWAEVNEECGCRDCFNEWLKDTNPNLEATKVMAEKCAEHTKVVEASYAKYLSDLREQFEDIRAELEICDCDECFDAFVSGQEHNEPAPSPTTLADIFREFGIDPDQETSVPLSREADVNNWRVITVPKVVRDGDCLLLQHRVDIEFRSLEGSGVSPDFWDVVNTFTTDPTLDHEGALEWAVDLGRDTAEILKAEALRANAMGAQDD